MTEIIAEIGINANGDLALARKLIDVAHSAGCDYVKFQKRDIDLVYTKEELDTPRESPWGTTTREQKQGLEFSIEDYNEIGAYCHNKIKWFVSPWDINSISMDSGIIGYKIPFIKISSALITNEVFLAQCRKTAINTDKQIILSTGMSTLDMVDRAIEILGKDLVYCIMHCTSTYPSRPEELNLNCIKTLKERYPRTKIGFSNHSPGIIYMPIAVALGAEMIEFHITLDRSMYGSDQAASIEPEGVFKLCKYLKSIPFALGDGIKCIYDSELPIIAKLRK